MDYIISCVIALGIAICIVFGSCCVSWGNGTVYDIIIPTRHYIDESGSYHFTGIIDSSHCGNMVDHIFTIKIYEFTVSRDLFYKSFGGVRTSIKYECVDGIIKNVTFI